MKNLVIVESQAKAKKIQGFLEKGFPSDSWKVHACLGHVRDLKDDESAVDPKNWNNLKGFNEKSLKADFSKSQ